MQILILRLGKGHKTTPWKVLQASHHLMLRSKSNQLVESRAHTKKVLLPGPNLLPIPSIWILLLSMLERNTTQLRKTRA